MATVVVVAVGTAGCSGSTNRVYDAERSKTSLEGAGWAVRRPTGTPTTLAGVRQVDYLETTAPDRQRVDLQFFETSTKAAEELAAAKRRDPRFKGRTIGSVLVIPALDGSRAVPGLDVAALESLLHT
jgi:hypothetical protein